MLFTDQMNHTLELSQPPKRIVSLVPSQTELLFDLGLDEEIVGITKFCIHPQEQFKKKAKVGGTKDFSIEKIRALHPDLIIGNKEENEEKGIKALMEEFPVWMSDITNLEEALQMIEGIAALTGKMEKGRWIMDQISINFASLDSSKIQNPKFKIQQSNNSTIQQFNNKSVCYFIWKNPYMAAGTNTFISDMLQRCGLENAIQQNRYPELTASEISAAQPDVIFLSSEPYPFKDKHLAEFKELCPRAIVKVVDGELFSWYGSRLLQAPEYFTNLLSNL